MTRMALVAAALVVAGCVGPQVQPQEAPKPEAKAVPYAPMPQAHLDPVTCGRLSMEGPMTVLYPAKAWEIRQEGWVHVRFDVDGEGAAANVRKLGASPAGIFDEAALEMLSKAKFTTMGLKDCEFVFGFQKQEPAK